MCDEYSKERGSVEDGESMEERAWSLRASIKPPFGNEKQNAGSAALGSHYSIYLKGAAAS